MSGIVAQTPTCNRIDDEYAEIDKLIFAAKMGQWEIVWEILGPTDRPKKAYLLNCIPENRRWGVLHQAVFWKNTDVLKRLLNYPGCDTIIKAKECTSECGPTGGKTALEIAQAYGYNNVVTLLQNNRGLIVDVEKTTFAPYDTVIEHKGMGLIAITLAAFKKTFCPEPIDKTASVTSILRDIFRKMNTSPTLWSKVKDHVCDTLFVVNPESSNNIKSGSIDREYFYQAIINTYTKETTYLYDHVNTALRKQTENDYHPTANDLAMGPYIIMYTLLLLFWDQLPKERSATYRNMLLSKEHVDKYRLDKRFTWLGFVSSSIDVQKAVSFPTCDAEGEFNITFAIDNSSWSMRRPRNIEAFAQYHEHERVYPPGAKFQVMGKIKRGDMTQVNLKLLS